MLNDEAARALRQISLVRPNPVWRVQHLVTFVERPALQGFGAAQAATVDMPPAAIPGAIASRIAPAAPNGNGRRAIATSAERYVILTANRAVLSPIPMEERSPLCLCCGIAPLACLPRPKGLLYTKFALASPGWAGQTPFAPT